MKRDRDSGTANEGDATRAGLCGGAEVLFFELWLLRGNNHPGLCTGVHLAKGIGGSG